MFFLIVGYECFAGFFPLVDLVVLAGGLYLSFVLLFLGIDIVSMLSMKISGSGRGR